MKTDREFMAWMHQRLVCIHDENPMYDYMHRFRAIMRQIPEKQTSPNYNQMTIPEVEKLAGRGIFGGYTGNREAPD